MDDDGADRRRDTDQATVPAKDPRTIARKYQLELCRRAAEENIIVYLGTGCGKTHIAVLLIYELRHLFEEPNKDICVFLAPSVPLVRQQALVIKNSTDLKVGAYSGESKHSKSHAAWEKEVQDHEVLVMTPQILLQNLRHCFIRMEQVALLIFDECHHAQLQKRHPYAQIMKEFYEIGSTKCPRIFGMTASPIMGKGGSDPLNYTKCINSLENLLNSKVCSVDDSELESVVASPNVKMYYYEPASSGGENSISAYTTKLEQMKDNSVSVVRKNNANIDDFKRKMKLLSRVHEDVLFCLETIGLCGAIQAARIISMSDEGSLGMENGTSVGNDEPKQHLDQIVSILNSETLNDGSLLAAPLEEPFFSKKLCALIGVLQRYRDNPNAKCIVFVKRIIIAKSLAWILKNLTTLGFWKCEFLVGFHSGSMSRSKMNNIVENFRSGEVNLLVATNVAEEGLDIPTCCLVIRFDLPETVASFIQSRGRARMSESEYVFLVERGNLCEEKLLENFRCDEVVMNQEITYRTSSEIFSHLDESTFKVETTGASISTGCSVSLLHHYCSKLPHDRLYKPAPKFCYFDDLNGTICKIILPSNCPIRQVESLPFYSKDEAKRAACLKACEELHTLGALSDFLLPNIGDKDKQESRAFELEQDESTREELHEMLMPNVIQGLNSHFGDQLSLHFYQINFVPIPDDRKYKKFGVFFRTYLPKEAETSKLDLHLALGRIVKTSLVPSGVIIFTKEEVMLAQNFQEMFLKIILDGSEFMSDVVQLGAESAAIHAPTFYLLLPIVQHVYDEKMSIDWGTVKLCLSSPIFSNPLYPIGRDLPLSDSSKTLILANGPVRKEDVVKSLVFNPDRKVFYFIEDILYDMNANSVMIGSKKLSYVEHYAKKFKIDLRYPEQPLFKAKRLFRVRNLLYNRLSANTVVQKKEEHFVELPPELCLLKIIGFSNEVGSSLSLLPSFMHRLEKLLVAIELKHVLSVSFSEALEISASRILEALTTEKCLERFSLERLEVLGDAFLKFVSARHSFVSYQSLDEGQLTQKRSRLVSNSNLRELAVAKGLQVYIYDGVFEPENFFALGRPCMIPCNHSAKPVTEYNTESGGKMYHEADSGTMCSKLHRWLQMKTIADVVEALIGAFLVDSGFKGAISFLKWIGIEVGYEGSNIQRICKESCNNLSVAYKLDISYIEKVLGYSFQFKGLLVQAFIHPSYIKHSGGCYQRLEFLGDAVLEYLVISYLYSTYPMLKPGQLTDLKSLIVSNNSFARITVQKDLHKYIIADCQATMEAINIFGRYIIQEDDQRDLVDEPHCPKVLGDVVESCIGAILLDSGFNMNCIWDTMMIFLGSALTFSNFNVSCIRELFELCQSCGFKPSIQVTEEKGEFLVNVDVNVDVDVNMESCMLHSSASNVSSKAARRLASQEMLTKLKDLGHKHKRKSLEEVLRDTRKEEGKLIGFDEKPVSLVVVSTRLDGLQLNDSEEASSSSIPDRTMAWRNLPQTNGFSEGTVINMPAKSRLFELCVVNHWNRPLFECCKEEGHSHLKMFTYKVTIVVQGIHNTLLECFGDPHRKKKAAQEHAAEGALWYLKNVGCVKTKTTHPSCVLRG